MMDKTMLQILIERYSLAKVIPYQVLWNLVIRESNGEPLAEGDGGNSIGLMQISKPTATDMGVNDYAQLYDPEYNIKIGTDYLLWIKNYLSPYLNGMDDMNMWKCITTSYNGGPSYMKKALSRLAAKGNPLTYDNAIAEMQLPDFGRSPYINLVTAYSQAVVPSLAVAQSYINQPSDVGHMTYNDDGMYDEEFFTFDSDVDGDDLDLDDLGEEGKISKATMFSIGGLFLLLTLGYTFFREG